MAKIVKLNEFLGEDVIFELPGGSQYTFPGDPPLELVIKIAALFERTEGSSDTDEGVALDVLKELDTEILGLLRMRDSSIEQSPFGVRGAIQVVTHLLAAYSFGEEGGDADPQEAPRPRSRRSSGSGRS